MNDSRGTMILLDKQTPQAKPLPGTAARKAPQSVDIPRKSTSWFDRLASMFRRSQQQKPGRPANLSPAAPKPPISSHHVLQRVAPKDVGVKYDPDLIAGLIADHKLLVDMFTDCVEAAEGREFGRIGSGLVSFKRVFNEHIVTENIRLYLYLISLTQEHSSEYEFLVSKRKEMGVIQRAVTDFIKTWVADSGASMVNDSNLRTFKEQLASTGKALLERIEMEEKVLYTLYMPS